MNTEKEFLQYIDQHRNILYKVCSLYMNNDRDKDDLFQEIILAAWKSFKNFRGDAKFSTWLYRVALNTAITLYRKEQRQVLTASLQERSAVTVNTEDNLQEQLAVMHQSINELSKIDKALVMLYMEDYNYTEIADMLGITANNVAVKINRIKLKLKESAKKYL